MTGRRLLIQILSWDFSDYRSRYRKRPQNSATKRWSKKSRRFLKKELNEELLTHQVGNIDKPEVECPHENWSRSGFTNHGVCHDCGIQFYFKVEENEILYRKID